VCISKQPGDVYLKVAKLFDECRGTKRWLDVPCLLSGRNETKALTIEGVDPRDERRMLDWISDRYSRVGKRMEALVGSEKKVGGESGKKKS
jgi:hypothetical protein